MYWDVVASMVQARLSKASKQLVYTLLAACKVDFEAFDVGEYGLTEWKPEGLGWHRITREVD